MRNKRDSTTIPVIKTRRYSWMIIIGIVGGGTPATATMYTDRRAARGGTSRVAAESCITAGEAIAFARVAGCFAADGGAGGAALAAPEPVGAHGVVACRADVILAAEDLGDFGRLSNPG